MSERELENLKSADYNGWICIVLLPHHAPFAMHLKNSAIILT